MPFDIAWPFGQSGPLAAFTDYYNDRDLYLVDLSSGILSTVAKASEREVMDVAMSGGSIVWVDGRYDGYKDLVPCGNQGGIDWRVRLTAVTTGRTVEVASGQQKDVAGYCAADSPRVAIDGNLVAYAAEHPTASQPHGWQVAVVDVDTDALVRSIQTDYGIFGLQIDRGDVAYIEGSYAPGGDFDPTHTWLMLSRATDAKPLKISKNSDDVSFADGRLAWSTCDQVSCSTMTTLSASVAPEVVGGSSWPTPVATADTVLFAVSRHPQIWSSQSNEAIPVSVMEDPGIVRANDGWLVWTNQRLVNDKTVFSINGLPLSDVPIPGS